MIDEDWESFLAFLKRNREEIKTWPKWKQTAFTCASLATDPENATSLDTAVESAEVQEKSS